MAGCADHLRHRPPQPGHRLDRRRRSATPSCKRRLDPRNDYVPVRLGDVNAQTRWVLERAGAARARVPAARHAARARRDARELPVGQPARAGPRGRPDDGARGPRPRADRRRRRRAGRRHDRARAGPPLHPRVARGRRASPTRPPRSSAIVEVARGRARGRRGRARSPAACGCWRWTSTSLPSEIGAGRRRRRRQPRRRPAARDRARRRAARDEQRHARPSEEVARARPRARARRSSPRRWTATSPAAWSRCRRRAAR